MRVITRSWQPVQACISVLYILRRASLCASRCVDSDYCDFLSFGLALGPRRAHEDTHRELHAARKCVQGYRDVRSPPPTPFQARPNERDRRDATGHRPPSAANEYSAVHRTSSACPPRPASFWCVAACRVLLSVIAYSAFADTCLKHQIRRGWPHCDSSNSARWSRAVPVWHFALHLLANRSCLCVI